MNYFFITGTSGGIGKSIATLLLADPHNFVIGFARNCSIEHERYTHIKIDLSDDEQVKEWTFPELKNATKIALVNNAGTLGTIRYVGNLDAAEIVQTFQLNLISPTILTNSFLKKYISNTVTQIIINVSSGAGKNPIDGWSVYCATKAGVDLFTKTIAEELKILNRKNIFVFSVAPGVVDTQMQSQIRLANKDDFSRVKTFVDYKNLAYLEQPDNVASKYLGILAHPEKFKEVVFSVKDI
jgi:benzil reductase ((S)-benzoin forming)